MTDTMIIAGARRLAALAPALADADAALLPDFGDAPRVNFEVAVAVVDKQEAQEAQRVVPKGAAEKGAAEKGAAEGGLVGRERRAGTRSECRAWTLERRPGCEWTE